MLHMRCVEVTSLRISRIFVFLMKQSQKSPRLRRKISAFQFSRIPQLPLSFQLIFRDLQSCIHFNIAQQIVPIGEGIDDPSKSSNNFKFSPSVRNKPGTKRNYKSHSTPNSLQYATDVLNRRTNINSIHIDSTVVEDIFLFTVSLSLEALIGQDDLVIRDNRSLVKYEFGEDNDTRSSTTAFLLAVISGLPSTSKTIQDDIVHVLISTEIITTLIEYMRNMEEGFIAFQESNFYLPLQSCLALTVS